MTNKRKFRETASDFTKRNLHTALLVGTTLDAVPLTAKKRILQIAKSLGFKEEGFYFRSNIYLLAKACLLARDRMLSEQLILGVNETDAAMQRLLSYIHLHISDLK